MQSISRWMVPALLVLGCLMGCKGEKPAGAPVRPVPAMKVGDVSRLIETTYPGRAQATEEVNLAFRVQGPLIARPVDVGDSVKRGDVVARVDPRDYETALANISGKLAQNRAELEALKIARPEDIRKAQADLAGSKADLLRAEADYQRYRQLYLSDNASKEDLDQYRAIRDVSQEKVNSNAENLRIARIGARKEIIDAKLADIKALEARQKRAQDALEDTWLRAPFDGYIAQTFVENYQNVRVKQPIVRLLDTSRIEIIISVPESLISLAPYVTEILCRFDAFPDRQLSAKIKEIGKEASLTTRTYPVTLIMEQPEDIQILPGMAGTVTARAAAPEDYDTAGVEVPLAAILADKDDRKFVWIITDGTKTVSQREVTVGALTQRGIRVTKGLKAGETIATAGVHYLTEGQKVEPMF